MSKKLRTITVILLVAGLLLCAGCGGGSPATPAPGDSSGSSSGTAPSASEGVKSTKDTLIIANTSGEPGNVHPYNTVSIGAAAIFYLLFEPLVINGEDGGLAPCLAESWDITDDGITFHLVKGAKFHDGTELKASDVVFSYQEVILNSSGGLAGNLESIDVDNIKATDDYTVYMPLKQPDTTLLAQLAQIFIVPEQSYKDLGEQFQFQPVGTGPFTFKDWLVGDSITVERFADYRLGTPLVSTVVVRTISEVSQAMIELETGGVDLVLSPLGSDVERVLRGELNGIKAITSDFSVLRNNNVNFNWLSDKLRDPKIREAIARSIDRETWVNIISPGVGVPSYSCIPPGVWGYNTSIAANYPYPYDLQKAKDLLAEAGYADGFTLRLLTDARPYHQTTVELLQNTLAQIGITLDIQTMELAQQKEIMATGEGFDLYMLDNVAFSPYAFLQPLWRDSHPRFATTHSSHNHFYTVNDAQGQKYADLLDEILITFDENKRLELCNELQQVFTEDLVWVPVNAIQTYFLAADNLQNTVLSGINLLITEKTYFN